MDNLIVNESLLFKVWIITISILLGSLGSIPAIVALAVLWRVATSIVLLLLTSISLAVVVLIAGRSFLVEHVCLSVLIQIEEFGMDQCHLVQSQGEGFSVD